uniref:Uncharacterized protein n=1 Tax=Ditylenchus dipsaci TaxID=166011 RepID=A0A915EC28_9BILA
METVDLKKLAAASAAFAPGSSKQTNKDEISMKEESKAAAKTKDKENGVLKRTKKKMPTLINQARKLLRQQEYDLEQERRKRVEKKREGRREKRRRQKERRKNKDPSAKKIKKQSNSSSSSSGSSSDSSNSSSDDDEVKVIAAKSKGATKELTKAIRKVQKEELEGKKLIEEGDRKRKYNSNFEVVQPTEVEKEAYNLTRIHASDPMAAYMTEKKEITSKKSKHS